MPGLRAVRLPLVRPMVATEGVPLLHVPPDGIELNTVVPPTHKAKVPESVVGVGFTVIGFVAKQPVGSV